LYITYKYFWCQQVFQSLTPFYYCLVVFKSIKNFL